MRRAVAILGVVVVIAGGVAHLLAPDEAARRVDHAGRVAPASRAIVTAPRVPIVNTTFSSGGGAAPDDRLVPIPTDTNPHTPSRPHSRPVVGAAPSEKLACVRGVVVDSLLRPLAGARVTLGDRTTRTDVEGGFSFEVAAGTHVVLTASDGDGALGAAAGLAGEAFDPIVCVRSRLLALALTQRGLAAQGLTLEAHIESELGQRTIARAVPATGRLELEVPDGALVKLKIAKSGITVAEREVEVVGADREAAFTLE